MVWLEEVGSYAAEEMSDPQEPHLTVLKGCLHCFVFLLITKADCNYDQQWDGSSGKDSQKLLRTNTQPFSYVLQSKFIQLKKISKTVLSNVMTLQVKVT